MRSAAGRLGESGVAPIDVSCDGRVEPGESSPQNAVELVAVIDVAGDRDHAICALAQQDPA